MAAGARSRRCLRGAALVAAVVLPAWWCSSATAPLAPLAIRELREPRAAFVAGARAPTSRRASPTALLRAAVSPQVMLKVSDIIADLSGLDKEMVTSDMPLKELGDSLDLAESIFYLEEAFDVTLTLEEAADLSSVGEVAHLIETKM